MKKWIFNGDIYYDEDDVNNAIVKYIYKTQAVGDQDPEETSYFEELWETVVEVKGVEE